TSSPTRLISWSTLSTLTRIEVSGWAVCLRGAAAAGLAAPPAVGLAAALVSPAEVVAVPAPWEQS
ncbi:MAG TPA: hypothetical protein PKC57_11900, partial [Microthrixaceae bacterium]|nr:hypothetical protein [Microthrixaceae bacterium]